MVDGFRVDLGALENAASGVNDTLRDLKDARVDSLNGNVSDYGHDQLAAAVQAFCERWENGVEHLAADGREIVQRLQLSVQDYLAADEAAKGRLDGLVGKPTGIDPAAH
jgi:hypothetical protein